MDQYEGKAVRRFHYNGPFSTRTEAAVELKKIIKSRAVDQIRSALYMARDDKSADELNMLAYKLEYVFSCGSKAHRDHAIAGLVRDKFFKSAEEAIDYIDTPLNGSPMFLGLFVAMGSLNSKGPNKELSRFLVEKILVLSNESLAEVKEKFEVPDEMVQTPLIL